MFTKYKLVLLLLINSLLFSCNESFKEENKSTEVRVDSICKKISSIEYRNVGDLEHLSNQLSAIKNNQKAQLLGRYYKLKASYFRQITLEKREKFKAFYETIKKYPEFDNIKFEIDLLLLKEYYSDYNFEEANKIFKNTQKYIFNPKFKLERDVLIYNYSHETPGRNKEVIIEEILKLLKKIEEKPWSIYHSNLYTDLCQLYLKTNDRKKAIETLEFIIDKNKRNNINSEVVSLLNSLGYFKGGQLGINYIKESIELGEKTGYEFDKYQSFRQLGHIYFNQKKYNKAYLEYEKSKNFLFKNTNRNEAVIDYAYMGYALFHINKNENFKAADSLFNLAIKLRIKMI